MIQSKREAYRCNIRRSNHEAIFKLKRQSFIIPTQTMAKLCEQLQVTKTEQSLSELNNLICLMPQHIKTFLWLLDINQEQTVIFQTVQIFYNLIGSSTEQQLEDTEELIDYLSAIIYDAKQYDITILELIFETLYIAAVKSLYWVGCCAKLIPSLITILPQVRIEYKDEGMYSLLQLITVMVAQQSKIPSTVTKDCIYLLNIISKKLRFIEYLSFNEESNIQMEDGLLPDVKLNVLSQLMTATKYYFDKHGETNICDHKNLFRIIRDCAFHQKSSLRLKKVALNVISVLTTYNSFTQVLQKKNCIVLDLIQTLQDYQQQIGEPAKIRATVSITLLNLLSSSSCAALINHHELAYAFIDLHYYEYNSVVFAYQLQCIEVLMKDREIFNLFIEHNLISSTCLKLQQCLEENNRLTIKYCMNGIISFKLVLHPILATRNEGFIHNCRQNRLDILLEKLIETQGKSIAARAEEFLQYFNEELL